MSSWHREYFIALENRDMHEKAQFDLFNAYTKLADRTSLNRVVSHRDSTIDPTMPAVSAGRVETSSSPVSSELLAKLRQDLVEAQRSKGALQLQLRMVTDEMQKLRSRSKTDGKRITELAADKTVLTTKLRDRDEELRGKAKLLEDVQDEMVSLNLQLNMAEETTRKLQKENNDLVDRWMARMGQEADAMNDASKYS